MSQLDKVALVTGGARGIGRSFVEHLLAEGAKVSVCDVRQDLGCSTVVNLLSTYPKKVVFVRCDVTFDKLFEESFQKTIKHFGGLDIVINNAGVSDEWSKPFELTVDINFNGVVRGTRLAFKYMSKEKGGNGGIVVNIASITCLEPFPSIPVYSATKAAINQFSRSYGHDFYFKKTGIKVIAINPGMTKTHLVDRSYESFKIVPVLRENLINHFSEFYFQNAGNMGRGLIQILPRAGNGSLWTIENDMPPKLTDLSKPSERSISWD